MISGLSLSVFVLSTFTPTQRMGWLMLSILLAGMVAELVMLPALLAGPLVKVFPIPPKQPKREDEQETSKETSKGQVISLESFASKRSPLQGSPLARAVRVPRPQNGLGCLPSAFQASFKKF